MDKLISESYWQAVERIVQCIALDPDDCDAATVLKALQSLLWFQSLEIVAGELSLEASLRCRTIRYDDCYRVAPGLTRKQGAEMIPKLLAPFGWSVGSLSPSSLSTPWTWVSPSHDSVYVLGSRVTGVTLESCELIALIFRGPDLLRLAEQSKLFRCVLPLLLGWFAVRFLDQELEPVSGVMQSLTPREAEVLDGLMRGWSPQVMAEHFNVSKRTVNFHLHNVYRKLGVTNRIQAVAKAGVWARDYGGRARKVLGPDELERVSGGLSSDQGCSWLASWISRAASMQAKRTEDYAAIVPMP